MNILLASSEMTPLAGSGELADSCRNLTLELARDGHDVTVILPAFRQARSQARAVEDLGVDLNIPVGNKLATGRLLRAEPVEGLVSVLLVEQDDYFDRPDLYQENGQDYIDNCERFVFFCRAVMEAVGALKMPLDILHANDWQTGLLPAYLHAEYRGVPGYEQIASVFTVHNIAFQGQFWHWDMMLTGLDWKYFNWQQMEFYGNLNLLKTGLAFADAITTLSPTYAAELMTPPRTLEANQTGLTHPIELPGGCGLQGVFQSRRDALTGILNGEIEIQAELGESPLPSSHAEDHPEEDNVAEKIACQRALRKELGLPLESDMPLIAVTGPISDPHGFDLILAVLQQWLPLHDAAWAIVGPASANYKSILADLARQFPQKLAVRLSKLEQRSDPHQTGQNPAVEQLNRRLLAVADILVLCRRFGAGGQRHQQAMRHGAIPVAFASGIPADTITDATSQTLAAETATGFLFSNYSTSALHTVLTRAASLYAQPMAWAKLVNSARQRRWPWKETAESYLSVYERAVKELRQRAMT